MKANFAEPATLVALDGPAHIALLGQLAKMGIGSGRSYDAVISVSASQARVDALVIFNPRHFDPPPQGVAVVEPKLV